MLSKLLPVLVIIIAEIYGEFLSKSWVQNDDLKGRVFDNPMFESTSLGLIDCAMTCAKKTCCQTLTFNPTTKGCSGYCRLSTTGDPFISDPGREVYQWITPPNNHTCVYDDDTNLCFSLITDDFQTKSGAAKQCELDNGYLIRIDSMQKYSVVDIVIRDYFKNVGVAYAWIDGEDYDKTNNYTMGNGQVLSLNNTAWGQGEPSHIDETCVGFWFGYLLNDFECNESLLYLCQY